MILTEGFLLGISTGAMCLAYCGPVLIPYLLGEGKNIRQSAYCLFLFLSGRMLAYIMAGFLVGILGTTLLQTSELSVFVIGVIYIILAVLLIIYGFHRFKEICLGHVQQKINSNFRKHFPKIVPLIGGVVTGLNICPPFLIAVIGISIAMGRGVCSWGCLYGGWDEGSSRILRKPVIKKVNFVFRWIPFAVLLIVVLWSAATLSPTYCWWLCPFKAVTEYEDVSSFNILLKTIVFGLLFFGLVIILPILTKKRIQCVTFCPMGAFLSLTNKINIFDIRINKEKCNKCEICARICPTLSIDQTNIEKGHPSITCTKCGKCIDVCSKQAIHYHIKGTSIRKNISLSRYLFLYPVFLFLVVIAGSPIRQGIVLIIKLITTESLL